MISARIRKIDLYTKLREDGKLPPNNKVKKLSPEEEEFLREVFKPPQFIKEGK